MTAADEHDPSREHSMDASTQSGSVSAASASIESGYSEPVEALKSDLLLFANL